MEGNHLKERKNKMEKVYAKEVIKVIEKNPQINYRELTTYFPDIKNEQLFKLLYVLCEERIISIDGKEEARSRGLKGIKRNRFSLIDNRSLDKRLDEIFLFWGLQNGKAESM